jgi:hypothetical protein
MASRLSPVQALSPLSPLSLASELGLDWLPLNPVLGWPCDDGLACARHVRRLLPNAGHSANEVQVRCDPPSVCHASLRAERASRWLYFYSLCYHGRPIAH